MNILKVKIINNIASILLGAVFFCSCSKASIKDWEEFDTSTKPEIMGYNVEIKQSKSGIVQFRLLAPKVIEQYKDDNPYIYITPKGIHIWQYDVNENLGFELIADSAYIIEPEQYYELWGNIVLFNKQDSTKVTTEKVIINQKENIIYTDMEVFIEKFRDITNGKAAGFKSDLTFEHPLFYKLTRGDVSYEELQLHKKNESIPSDSTHSSQRQTEHLENLIEVQENN